MESRTLVAMSGGVDSSVAAALLLEAGRELVGITLHLWDARGESQVGRCCAPEDRDDARGSCDHLGIPHYVLDEREAFRAQVVEPFIDAYARGETPSPCVHCNRTVKLVHLVEVADRFGAGRIATGHYARVLEGPEGPRLLRGVDRHKDQSYFLWGVPREVLARVDFPLGEMVKDESRAHARRLGLPNAAKKDSQELCFVPDGDVRGFVQRERGVTRAGKIVDTSGAELATHEGVEGFTVGQRRGLGLGGGPPRYVLRVIGEDATVVVGADEALFSDRAEARAMRWLGRPPESSFEAEVRVRYRHEPARATVSALGGDFSRGVSVRFAEKQRAITPGQAAVIYREDEVLGGGFIV